MEHNSTADDEYYHIFVSYHILLHFCTYLGTLINTSVTMGQEKRIFLKETVELMTLTNIGSFNIFVILLLLKLELCLSRQCNS